MLDRTELNRQDAAIADILMGEKTPLPMSIRFLVSVDSLVVRGQWIGILVLMNAVH